MQLQAFSKQTTNLREHAALDRLTMDLKNEWWEDQVSGRTSSKIQKGAGICWESQLQCDMCSYTPDSHTGLRFIDPPPHPTTNRKRRKQADGAETLEPRSCLWNFFAFICINKETVPCRSVLSSSEKSQGDPCEQGARRIRLSEPTRRMHPNVSAERPADSQKRMELHFQINKSESHISPFIMSSVCFGGDRQSQSNWALCCCILVSSLLSTQFSKPRMGQTQKAGAKAVIDTRPHTHTSTPVPPYGNLSVFSERCVHDDTSRTWKSAVTERVQLLMTRPEEDAVKQHIHIQRALTDRQYHSPRLRERGSEEQWLVFTLN